MNAQLLPRHDSAPHICQSTSGPSSNTKKIWLCQTTPVAWSYSSHTWVSSFPFLQALCLAWRTRLGKMSSRMREAENTPA